jgi:large subunit ribosomal protein L32e
MLSEMLVSNVDDLKTVNKEKQAVRISSTVGNRKRFDIQSKASELGLKVLNPKKIELKKPKEKTKEKPAEKPKEHKHEEKK